MFHLPLSNQKERSYGETHAQVTERLFKTANRLFGDSLSFSANEIKGIPKEVTLQLKRIFSLDSISNKYFFGVDRCMLNVIIRRLPGEYTGFSMNDEAL